MFGNGFPPSFAPGGLGYEPDEFFGERGGKVHFLAGHGMEELEEAGVQSQALGRIGFCPVFFIPDDRTSGFGEVDADLVPASGLKGELDERAPFRALKHAIVSDCVAGRFAGRRAMNFERICFI